MNINMGLGLDSALAINYLTHTLWAWIAFLTTTTAALSLWKFKSTNYYLHNSHRHHPLRLSPSLPPQTPSPQTSADEPDQQQSLPPAAPTTSSSISSRFCWLENRKSGKFKVYCYGGQVDELMDDHAKDDMVMDHDDDIIEHNNNNNIATPVTVVGGGGGGRSHIHLQQQQQQEEEEEEEERLMKSKGSNNPADGWDWEAVLKLKTGEMDWYRHQDLRLLDGNVVRLWNCR